MKWRDAAESLSQSRFKNNRLVAFIASVFVELDATTWPTKEEIVNSTIIVLITVAFFTVYMGVVDYVLSQLQNSFYSALERMMTGG